MGHRGGGAEGGSSILRAGSPPPFLRGAASLRAPGLLTWSMGSRMALLSGCSSVEPVVLVAMAEKALPPPQAWGQAKMIEERERKGEKVQRPPPLPSLLPQNIKSGGSSSSSSRRRAAAT